MITTTCLALDLGSRTGWAVACERGGIEHGSQDFSPSGASEADGVRFLRFRSWLHDVKRRYDARDESIGLVLFERVDFMVEGQVYAAHVWGGFWGHLTAWCEHHQLPYRGYAPGTIKKAVTGSGRASKAEVMVALERRGFKVADHNEADAIALLLAAGTRSEAA